MFIDEVRFGFLYHEDSRGSRVFSTHDKDREGSIFDATFEILLVKPKWNFTNPLLNFALTPRLRAGTSINFGGGTSHVNGGLAWDVDLFKRLFAEAALGIAAHNGYLGNNLGNGRKMGCNPLAYMSGSFGRSFGQHWRIMLMVEHLDNFEACHENGQLTNIGARAGYRF